MQKEKVIYTYVGLDIAKEGTDVSAYFAYDPDIDVHYELTKEEYEKAMRNAKPTQVNYWID